MRRIGYLMDDEMKTGITSVVILFICSSIAIHAIAQTKTSKPEFAPDTSIGWLHGNCFAVKNSHLANNSDLLVVRLDDVQKITPAKILGPATNGKECFGLLNDRSAVNRESGVTFYRVSSETPIELGIGVASGKALSKQDLRELNTRGMDLNNDGRKETFSQCATAEGVHFSVWDGAAYKGRLIWSGYYYLGYDTKANCPS